MLFLIMILAVSTCAISLFAILDNPKKTRVIVCLISLGLSIISITSILALENNAIIREEEQVNIRITDVENFKVKISGDFATWDDAEGITYIVPTDKIVLNTFADDKLKIFRVTKCKEIKYYPEWAKFLLDFGLLEIAIPQHSVTYEFEVPERSITYSNIQT